MTGWALEVQTIHFRLMEASGRSPLCHAQTWQIRDADADFVAQAVNDYGAFLGIVEAAQDFLASVYPCGTAHPADAEADRLRRAIERLT